MGRSPAHQILIWWAAARSGPSIFQRMGRGPAQPITFSKIYGPARPGPSHGSEGHETRALYGPARQLGGPARGFDGPAHGPAHVLFRTKTCMYILRCHKILTLIVGFSLFLSRLDSVGQLLLAHETHNQYPLLTQSCSTNDSVGWLPVGHHLLVLLQRPQQHQQQQEHVLLQHPMLLQHTLLHHPLSSKGNASTSSDILAAGSHATAARVLIPGSTSTHMKVNVGATFGQKISPIWAYFTKLHRRFRRRDEPGQERHAACVDETASIHYKLP